ncbi:hypothetical protein [Xanthomonas indica]|uniref:Class I SAM-dependent methyltransferase n=1 Tax=Xanthomonas indica TaxID=2912242 RepID=A0AAU8I8I0_9XANT|nr:hypothetical protein [Xanthomonas indica]MCI2261474.1 hypothetical protein [Xanthomonas indica]
MTLFQLVKATLDVLYGEAKRIYGNETDVRISNAMAQLSAAYTNLLSRSRVPINYQDPVIRFAYVYKYVAAHGDYVYQSIELLHERAGGPFLPNRLRLTCIGGGPGSDLIAMLKFLSDSSGMEVEKVTCYLIDGEQAWADTWTELDDAFELPFRLSTNFQRIDVAQPGSWVDQRKFLDADIFTISYFVSEVMSLDQTGAVTDFWKTVFANAKSGALFCYIDNGADVFNDYFDNIWKASGLQPVITHDNVRMLPRYDEEKGHLGEFLGKFGQQPKLQSIVSIRILHKP